MNIAGIILSGGPDSVYSKKAPSLDMEIFNLNIPVLGICYGMQIIVKLFGELVSKACKQEYGSSEIFLKNENSLLFSKLPNKFQIIMSHGDSIEKIPNNFKQLAFTKNCIASISNETQKIYGLQFHPEVTPSEVSLKIQLTKNISLNIPFLNSAMDTAT
ncbi:glutamine amidotransferase-related protein [Borreliella lusitaniae]|uniref:glutamine amidotransferase-related protein n=1 Tax=Borreliella lusitaniae TaxID=100177 RepID=UPI003C77A088